MGIPDTNWMDYIQPSWERDADCHYGDHFYEGSGAICSNCGYFNAPLLNWLRVEKAEKEGRHHGNHYHLTTGAAAKCKRKDHDKMICANTGGCMHHDASDKWIKENIDEDKT